MSERPSGGDERREPAARGGVHPALWIALFFTVLIALEASFFVVASVQPDDRIEPARAGRDG